MRRSNTFVICLLVLLAGFLMSLVDVIRQQSPISVSTIEAGALVKRLGLTDLTLFTEARYTRHPTQADLHSPFQDHPGALEHFPSGSLLLPPLGITQ
jgi:hypothetical protein